MSALRPRALMLACLLAASLAFLVPAVATADEGISFLDHDGGEGLVAKERLPIIDAPHAALVDEHGALWYGRAAEERAQIASLTKIMTALVATKHLRADDVIAVTAAAASVGESSAGLLEGDEMTFDDALKALLTASGNDAAAAIAEAAGAELLNQQGGNDGPEERVAAFVDAMNNEAHALGLKNTLFTNPHGLDFDQWDEGQYSCARDVAVMLRAAMENDLVHANIAFSRVDVSVRRAGATAPVHLENTDMMLEGYEGTCAAKTGYTMAAGPCEATAVNRKDGHEYYAVVLGASSKEQRFADSVALYDWVYENRSTIEQSLEKEKAEVLDNAGSDVKDAPTFRFQLVRAPDTVRATLDGVEEDRPVVARVALADWANRTVAATVAEPSKTVESPDDSAIEQEVSFSEIHGPVLCGDVVGSITFKQNGHVLWQTELIAAESIDAPSWWEAIGVGAQRLVAFLSGGAQTAASELENLEPVCIP